MPLEFACPAPDSLGILTVTLPCGHFRAQIIPGEENGRMAECPVCHGRWQLVLVTNEELDAVGSRGTRSPTGLMVIMVRAGAVPGG